MVNAVADDFEAAAAVMENQGTQVMEELVSPVPNYEQWADEVVKVAQETQIEESSEEADPEKVFRLNGVVGLSDGQHLLQNNVIDYGSAFNSA